MQCSRTEQRVEEHRHAWLPCEFAGSSLSEPTGGVEAKLIDPSPLLQQSSAAERILPPEQRAPML